MKKNLFVYLFFGLFVLVGCVWTCQNIHNYDEYRRLEGVAAPVNATVTQVKASGDEDEPYDIYISYVYEGVSYDNIKYERTTRADMLGKTIALEIDPEEPTTWRPEDPGMFLPIIACIFIVPAGYALVASISGTSAEGAARKRWGEVYSGGVVSVDLVREDVLLQENRRCTLGRRIALGLLAATAVGCACYCMLHGTATAFMGFLPPVALIMLWVFLTTRERELQIELKETEITRINVKVDSDGAVDRTPHGEGIGRLSDARCPLVSLQGRSWKESVVKGAEFHVAVVNGEARRLYRTDEFRCEKVSAGG